MSKSIGFLQLWYLYLSIRQLPKGKNYRRRVFECAKNSGIRFTINYEDGENDATTKVILEGFAKLNDKEILEKCYEGIFIIDSNKDTDDLIKYINDIQELKKIIRFSYARQYFNS